MKSTTQKGVEDLEGNLKGGRVCCSAADSLGGEGCFAAGGVNQLKYRKLGLLSAPFL